MKLKTLVPIISAGAVALGVAACGGTAKAPGVALAPSGGLTALAARGFDRLAILAESELAPWLEPASAARLRRRGGRAGSRAVAASGRARSQ